MKYATRGETLHLVRFRSDAKPWDDELDARCAIYQHVAERKERGDFDPKDYPKVDGAPDISRDYQMRDYRGDGFYVLVGGGALGWLTY